MGVEVEEPSQPQFGNVAVVDGVKRREPLLKIGATVGEPKIGFTLGGCDSGGVRHWLLGGLRRYGRRGLFSGRTAAAGTSHAQQR